MAFSLLSWYPAYVLVSLLGDSVLAVDLPVRQVREWQDRKTALSVILVAIPIFTPCFGCSNSSMCKICFVEMLTDAVPSGFFSSTLTDSKGNTRRTDRTGSGRGLAPRRSVIHSGCFQENPGCQSGALILGAKNRTCYSFQPAAPCLEVDYQLNSTSTGRCFQAIRLAYTQGISSPEICHVDQSKWLPL